MWRVKSTWCQRLALHRHTSLIIIQLSGVFCQTILSSVLLLIKVRRAKHHFSLFVHSHIEGFANTRRRAERHHVRAASGNHRATTQTVSVMSVAVLSFHESMELCTRTQPPPRNGGGGEETPFSPSPCRRCSALRPIAESKLPILFVSTRDPIDAESIYRFGRLPRIGHAIEFISHSQPNKWRCMYGRLIDWCRADAQYTADAALKSVHTTSVRIETEWGSWTNVRSGEIAGQRKQRANHENGKNTRKTL